MNSRVFGMTNVLKVKSQTISLSINDGNLITFIDNQYISISVTSGVKTLKERNCRFLFFCSICNASFVFSVPQCSVTCGVGRATRQVTCSNYHHPVDPSFCDPDERPAAEQECTAAPCPSVYNRQHIYEQPYGYPLDPRRHPGHSSWNVPSADNQWRTGPWGSV